MFRTALQITLVAYISVWTICSSQGADKRPDSDEQLRFFESRIRPALIKHCYECHSADAAEPGGRLRLDTRDGLLSGGESGAAIVPGDVDSSLLMHAVRYDGLQMPPEQPLPEAVINDFAEWIRRGAHDPRMPPKASGAPDKEHREGEPDTAVEHWSLQPVRLPEVPSVEDSSWCRSEIDRFILAKLETAKFSPGIDADARTLLRRLSFDLIGLPPGPQEIQEFAAAYQQNSGSAIETAVDDLLARPQFGERWGRHWLDVARYGESNGNDGLGRNPTFPHAWRYRDYVIAALNSDMPYDRFLKEQIAGDLMSAESDEERDRLLVATGFLALGAKPAKAMNNDFEMDIVADQLDVIGRGIMGLSVGCARCHDHKFDPIPTRDYYALAGIFTSSETMWGLAANEGLTAPTTPLHVLKAAPHVKPPEGFVETVLVLESNTGIPKKIPKPPWPVGTPLAMGVRDRKEPADCRINLKGDSKKLGEPVPRGFLSACRLESQDVTPVDAQQSGRLQLAEWLTRADHPLTARVMVNRIWQQLFGEGIVRTPDEFGLHGERPTHPELLDYLAVRFMDDGWSIKRLIRQIVLSRTYQLSSRPNKAQRDSDVTELEDHLAIHRRRRLDAESLRDSMLQVSGRLDLTPGEGSLVRHRDILVNLAGSLHEDSPKRSVYLCYLRSSPPPELAAFDLPEFTSVIGKRDISTVPAQALHLYNSPFVIEQSSQLAKRVLQQHASQDERLRFLWSQAFQRFPDESEIREAGEFLKSNQQNQKAEEELWQTLCHAILMASEFRYVD